MIARTPGGADPSSGRPDARRPNKRRGSLLAEVAMATVILMIAMSLTVKVLGWVALERRAADYRERAAMEAANLMERITSYPFQEVTPDLARRLAQTLTTARSLPDSDLTVEVTDSDLGGKRSAKKIAIRLRWKGRSGEWETPVRLTSWIERKGPAS